MTSLISRSSLAVLIFSLLTPAVGQAALETGESLGAHVHGVAELNVAQDGNQMEIEFHTPAANVYGFEYKPRTEVERVLVHKVNEKLEHGDDLFGLTAAASCKLTEAHVKNEHEEHEHDEHKEHEEHEHEHDEHKEHEEHEHEHDEHKEHAEHEHEHDEHKEHEEHENEHDEHKKHAEHEHQHNEHKEHEEHQHEHEGHEGHDHGDESVHSEVVAHYTYQCDNPDSLNSLTVNLFQEFPALEKLNLQLITPRNQVGKTLTAEDNQVTF